MNEILVFAIDKALAKGCGIDLWGADGVTNVSIKPCPVPYVIQGDVDLVDLEKEIKEMASRIQVEKGDDYEL